MKVRQLSMNLGDERRVESPPLIKSAGAVVHLELHAYVWLDEGNLQVSWQASDANTDELYEWRMPPVVLDRGEHDRKLAEACQRFLVLYQEHTTPF